MTEPKPNSVWKHYKGKNYLVKEIVTHTETNEKMVVYTDDVQSWVRPLSMWFNCVGSDEDGKAIFRFTEV